MNDRRDEIVIEGASEHNLRSIDVVIPRNCLTVVTGVSGSGKSSLVFDTIGREAQRRFLETMPAYARQFLGRLRRPAARRITGLSPAVVLDQRPTTSNPRSTVGTMTEVWDLLRLLFARAGTAPDGIRPTRGLFSFNGAEGACPSCQGFGIADQLDPELLIADPTRSLRGGALRVTTPTGYLMYSQVTLDVLNQVLAAHGGSVDTPWRDLGDELRHVVLYGSDRIRIPFGKHPLENRLRWKGITARPRQEGLYKGLVPIMEQILRTKRTPSILRFVRSAPCPACGGSRLRPEALAVTFHGHDIAALGALSAGSLATWLRGIDPVPQHAPVVAPIREALLERLDLLAELGLAYLTSDRPAATLSAGEAQRVRLVTPALGALRSLLIVLDEPSIGLHPRDIARLLTVLRRLRDAGNTVLVVEHDEAAVRGADFVVDLGPGAGADGGRVLFSGPPAGLLSGDALSPTRAWLQAPPPSLNRIRRTGSGELRLAGVTRNNLHGITASLLRGALNVITGVSGAGKTSLVEELLARARAGVITPPFARVLAVDQAPIGRTPRSNPATYTGVFDAIRDLFAATPAACSAGLSKGHFSFNVAGGRCEACEGAGVIDVGMRFLGTVEVPCEACGGRRFTPEVLAVEVDGRSIVDVLTLRIDEARACFSAQPRIARTLATLHDLGLGYLALGQPATTLSGGEAQRVKLAAELARPAGRGALITLDEPTTGLHAADVAVLLSALARLVDAGATVVVVEHDRQVIAAADQVVDLGPESGDGGGRIVIAGPPEAVAACRTSFTGAALRGKIGGTSTPGSQVGDATHDRPSSAAKDDAIVLRGVRTHNLAGIDVVIPNPGLTVITGPSGSGKSSLAHDTLAAEAHARFAETLSPWARRFLPRHGAAELDSATGMTAVVSVSQRPGRRNPRASVATATEVGDLLRLIWARAGVWECPRCGGALEGGTCVCGFRLDPPPSSSSFSPNAEAGACPRCRGLGFLTLADPDRLVTDPNRPVTNGALDGTRIGRFFAAHGDRHVATLRTAAAALGIDVERPWRDLDPEARTLVMRGAGDRTFAVEWRFSRGARTGVHRFTSVWAGFAGLIEAEYERLHDDERGTAIEPLLAELRCPECHGTRLGALARGVRFAGRTLPEVMAATLDEVRSWLGGIIATGGGGSARALAVSDDPRGEISERLDRLAAAGLGYLSLDRELATLSAGETQRLRLAAQVTGGLIGITTVLDEPTAGLHPRDTFRLLGLLRGLAADGAVVVVEHDADIIAAADHVIELGPGAGTAGGRIVAQGPPARLAADPTSATGELLRRRGAGLPGRARRAFVAGITVRGARAHNLRDLDVTFPSGALTAVTGVSGSGKSTLVFDVLGPALDCHLRGLPARAGEAALDCHMAIGTLLQADRHDAVNADHSIVASFIGVWDRLRTLLAKTDEARARGLSARAFSIAVPGGRCETCHGHGVVTVAMDLLPDVTVGCESCGGARFSPEVLAVRLAGKNVAELLDATIAEAAADLAGYPAVVAPLHALVAIGLDYLRLGQVTATLSGGELQRLRLAPVLAEARADGTVILLDEPTTGLHHRDVDRLVASLHDLVERGATVIVVEHSLDVIASCDHVIDLGPEGGPGGGSIVAAGPPEVIAAAPTSHTGAALAARFAAAVAELPLEAIPSR